MAPPGIEATLLDLEQFLIWCQLALQETLLLRPDHRFKADLNLDDVEMFQLTLMLIEYIGGDAIVDRNVFQSLETVRDLHIYYLTISAMPNG